MEKSDNEILEIIKNDDFLFKNILSLYYPFTASEIDEYAGLLVWGDAYYTVFLENECHIIRPNLGLCFNENIHWNKQLRNRWTVGLFNPYFGGNIMGDKYDSPNEFSNFYLHNYLKETRDDIDDRVLDYIKYIDKQANNYFLECDMNTDNDVESFSEEEKQRFENMNIEVNGKTYNLKDVELLQELYRDFVFNMMKSEDVTCNFKYNNEGELSVKFIKKYPNGEEEIPLSIEVEAINRFSALFDYDTAMSRETGECNYGMYNIHIHDYQKLTSEEFKKIYSKIKYNILLNMSIWDNTLKQIFTREIVFDMLDKKKTAINNSNSRDVLPF